MIACDMFMMTASAFKTATTCAAIVEIQAIETTKPAMESMVLSYQWLYAVGLVKYCGCTLALGVVGDGSAELAAGETRGSRSPGTDR
ncbi:hypothetical protein KCU74_g41, partial [Aureobasidium melanogenum]